MKVSWCGSIDTSNSPGPGNCEGFSDGGRTGPQLLWLAVDVNGDTIVRYTSVIACRNMMPLVECQLFIGHNTNRIELPVSDQSKMDLAVFEKETVALSNPGFPLSRIIICQLGRHCIFSATQNSTGVIAGRVDPDGDRQWRRVGET